MIAVSAANEQATSRLGENPSAGRRQTSVGVYRSSEARFDPEELEIPKADEVAPGEHAQYDEVINRRDENSETGAQVASQNESWNGPGENIITIYLREIGRVSLLTREEENELAVRIQRGDLAARDKMIKANLRLVVTIARAYEGMGMPLLDLISEGNIGLMRAVERYDPGKGAKLSSYSSWWIKHEILLALANQSKVTRLPMHVMEKLGKMRRVSLRFQEELGREATNEELAAELGTTASRVARMRMAVNAPVSLNAEVEGDSSRSYAELFADDKAETPCQMLERKAVQAMVREVIDTLTAGRRPFCARGLA